MFTVGNELSGFRVFGVVVGTFRFAWDTGNYTEYSMIFSNMFDSVSPSYHDKTVELA